MIRTEKEYQVSFQRIVEAKQAIAETRAYCAEHGLDEQTTDLMLESPRLVLAEAQADVDRYEKARRFDFGVVPFAGLGRLLVEARLGVGVSQRELAQRLGVDESTVSRDEKNEYQGIGWERAARIFDALGVDVGVVAHKDAAPAPPAFPFESSNASHLVPLTAVATGDRGRESRRASPLSD